LPEFARRRAELRPRVALLCRERAQALLVGRDAALRGSDRSVQRVAQADRRAPPLLARRRVEPRGFGALRRGPVRIGRGLLATFGLREHATGFRPDAGGVRALGGELVATRQDLAPLALDRGRGRIGDPPEIAAVRIR